MLTLRLSQEEQEDEKRHALERNMQDVKRHKLLVHQVTDLLKSLWVCDRLHQLVFTKSGPREKT